MSYIVHVFVQTRKGYMKLSEVSFQFFIAYLQKRKRTELNVYDSHTCAQGGGGVRGVYPPDEKFY